MLNYTLTQECPNDYSYLGFNSLAVVPLLASYHDERH